MSAMNAIQRFQSLEPAIRAAVLAQLEDEERSELLFALDAIAYNYDRTLITRMFPDSGPFSRDRYVKQLEFYELGASYRFRALLGGNGAGKTLCGGCELVYHATGEYPDWWAGYRYETPIKAWVAGDTINTVRDIIQPKLLGDEGAMGTGLFPAKSIFKVVYRQNGNGAIDWMLIRHKSGGLSKVRFKSYDQGRKTFQGEDVHFIWLDEECPIDIYTECVHRFRGSTRDGRLILTFTPLKGITDVVKLFVPQFSGSASRSDSHESSRTFVLCGWEDVPHITEAEKRERLANTLAYEREARTRGIPSVGRGRIFTVEEEFFVVRPFAIPPSWPVIYGADFGFGAEGDENTGTAVVWGAWDRTSDTCYLFDEYFRHQAPPAVHATAVKARGEWMQGVGDYSGKTMEGEKTIDLYKQLGLKIINADKSVYAGLQLMTQMLNEGRLRVFSSCQKWLEEYRLYSFNERQEVIKQRDHLMDATRYLLMADRHRATIRPIPKGRATVPGESFGLYKRNR